MAITLDVPRVNWGVLVPPSGQDETPHGSGMESHLTFQSRRQLELYTAVKKQLVQSATVSTVTESVSLETSKCFITII